MSIVCCIMYNITSPYIGLVGGSCCVVNTAKSLARIIIEWCDDFHWLTACLKPEH